MMGNSRYQHRPFTPFQRPVPSIRRTKVTVEPAEEPVTLEEVKAWLGITDTANDTTLTNMIVGARQNLEDYCRRAFVEQTIVMTLDQWPNSTEPLWEGTRQGSRDSWASRDIELLKPSLMSVNEVRYVLKDNSSVVYNAANYYVDTSDHDQYGRVALEDGASMPSDIRNLASWEFDYQAGYGATAADVPYAIKQALLQLVAYLFTNRGDCASGDGINSRGAVLNPIEASGAAGLLEPYRILRL